MVFVDIRIISMHTYISIAFPDYMNDGPKVKTKSDSTVAIVKVIQMIF
jgi:hypothetical protein